MWEEEGILSLSDSTSITCPLYQLLKHHGGGCPSWMPGRENLGITTHSPNLKIGFSVWLEFRNE